MENSSTLGEGLVYLDVAPSTICEGYNTYAALVDRTQGLQENCNLLEKHPEVRKDSLMHGILGYRMHTYNKGVPSEMFALYDSNSFSALCGSG